MKDFRGIAFLIFSFLLIIGCQNNEDATKFEELKSKESIEKSNIELVKKTWDEWNKRNREFLDSALDSNYTFYPSSGNPMSHETTMGMLEMFWNAFPDLTLDIQDIMASNDMVVSRLISRGTHEGEFTGIPATGNNIEITGINIVRIKEGKIIEEWETFDVLSMMMQLGMELKPKGK
jgi:steroid delta-isomerase-like uncharacterized protein